MEAGRDLDRLIAEKVMGVEMGTLRPNQFSMSATSEPKPYSTDIAAAWEVLEKLSKNEVFTITNMNYAGDVFCSIGDGEAQAPTAPHAICLAALAAVGV